MERSQRRELSQQMSRSTGSYELVFSAILLALIGFGLDRWLGTTPYLTVIAGFFGFAGAAIRLYYGYERDMTEHEANAPWAQPRHPVDADARTATDGSADG